MNRCMINYLHPKSAKNLSNYVLRGSVRMFPRWGTLHEEIRFPFCLAYKTMKYSLVEVWNGSECCSCIIKPSITTINNTSLCITLAGLLLLLFLCLLVCCCFSKSSSDRKRRNMNSKSAVYFWLDGQCFTFHWTFNIYYHLSKCDAWTPCTATCGQRCIRVSDLSIHLKYIPNSCRNSFNKMEREKVIEVAVHEELGQH